MVAIEKGIFAPQLPWVEARVLHLLHEEQLACFWCGDRALLVLSGGVIASVMIGAWGWVLAMFTDKSLQLSAFPCANQHKRYKHTDLPAGDFVGIRQGLKAGSQKDAGKEIICSWKHQGGFQEVYSTETSTVYSWATWTDSRTARHLSFVDHPYNKQGPGLQSWGLVQIWSSPRFVDICHKRVGLSLIIE